MVEPLTIVIVILYILVLGAIGTSIVASRYRAPHVTGPVGKEGYLGEQGTLGVPGSDGPTGATGPIYLFGAVGYGHTGVTGGLGPTGWAGRTGLFGPTGPTGPATGATGNPGPRGASPVQGTTGPTGGVGNTGLPGHTGAASLGPVFATQHYVLSSPLTGTDIFLLAVPPVILTETIPAPVPAEFTLAAGVLQFNLPLTSYNVRVGMVAGITGLSGSWAPATVTLSSFPEPGAMPPMAFWATPTGVGSASLSVGTTIVYTTPAIVPVTFTPSLTVSVGSAGASINVTLLSITLEHAADAP